MLLAVVWLAASVARAETHVSGVEIWPSAHGQVVADYERPFAATETVEGQTPQVADRQCDCASELWIVSTRNLPSAGCGCQPPFEPCVQRFECGAGWFQATLEELVGPSDPRRATVVFVHGNDTDFEDAHECALQLYRQLLACSCQPFRLVVWSWPSETTTCCVREDTRNKACRTNIEGYFLATFIDRLPPDTRLGLAGYSFGSRVITGGLHVLGGGVLEGRCLAERRNLERHPPHVLIMAAAMANDWLQPGMRHDRAISQVQRMIITYNRFDPVLCWYPMLWGCGGAPALGVTGIADPMQLGIERFKIGEVNVAPAVHCRHGWRHYRTAPEVMALFRREMIALPMAETVP